MIFCARATRGLRRPSLGLMARLGVPVGGRVRKLRAVEDHSVSIPKEVTSKLGGGICTLARRPQCNQHGCQVNLEGIIRISAWSTAGSGANSTSCHG